MVVSHDVIKIKDKPLFERAKFEAPHSFNYELENLACFFYLLKGNYEAVVTHGEFKLGRKEALVKKCGNYMTRFLKSEEGNQCEAVAIYLYPEVLLEIYKHQTPSFLKEQTPIHPPKKIIANELLDKYINNLLIYFDNPSLIDEDLAILKLKELIMILLKSEHYENVKAFFTSIFSPGKLEFSTIIENNIFSNVSIEELAFICNKSLSSFKREFKSTFGETPARYIKNRRLEQAAHLLSSTEEAISNIAYDCCFQDVSTFSASFQQKYKTSPSQYRLDKIRKIMT